MIIQIQNDNRENNEKHWSLAEFHDHENRYLYDTYGIRIPKFRRNNKIPYDFSARTEGKLEVGQL